MSKQPDPLAAKNELNAQIVHSWRTPDSPVEWCRIKMLGPEGTEHVLPLFTVIHDGRNSWFYRPGKHVYVHPDAIRYFAGSAVPTTA